MGVNITRLEVFRAGKQTDSAGSERVFTEADLDKTVNSYDPAVHEAPICIGHPEHNAPAWGWVEKVYREGKTLFCDLKDVADDFAEMLKQKKFKKRSISLYPDLSLRHIGFLGAQPPAVKGLADFAFADGDKKPMEFMDWQTSNLFRALGRLLQGLRDARIADTKDVAAVDKVLDQYDIDQLKAAESEDSPYAYQETPTEDPNMKTVAQLEAEIATFSEKQTATESALATEKAARATAEGRVTALEAQVTTLVKDGARREHASFCERMITAGKMLPAKKAAAIAFMESIAGQAAIEFSEGEGANQKTVKKTPLDLYKAEIEAGPKLIHFGEIATPGVAGTASEADKLTQLTEAEMKADPSLNYSEASRRVLAKNPDLNIVVED